MFLQKYKVYLYKNLLKMFISIWLENHVTLRLLLPGFPYCQPASDKHYQKFVTMIPEKMFLIHLYFFGFFSHDLTLHLSSSQICSMGLRSGLCPDYDGKRVISVSSMKVHVCLLVVCIGALSCWKKYLPFFSSNSSRNGIT